MTPGLIANNSAPTDQRLRDRLLPQKQGATKLVANSTPSQAGARTVPLPQAVSDAIDMELRFAAQSLKALAKENDLHQPTRILELVKALGEIEGLAKVEKGLLKALTHLLSMKKLEAEYTGGQSI